MKNSLLLISSSMGFVIEPVLATKGPWGLKVFKKDCSPWVLERYEKNELRIFKGGLTVLDILIFLENGGVLPSFEKVIVCFGIVEGWNRDRLVETYDGQIKRLLYLAKDSKYYDDLKRWDEYVRKGKAVKTIFSKDMFESYLVEFSKKVKTKELLFIVFNEKMFKNYTRESLKEFNDVIRKNFTFYEFNELKTFDGVHLTLESHNVVKEKIRKLCGFDKMHDGYVWQLFLNLYEYFQIKRFKLQNLRENGV